MDTLLQEVNNLLKDYEETKNAFKELSEFNALLQEELRLARDQERNAESKKARYQDFLKQQQEIIQTLLAVKEENENLKCKLNQTEITLSMVQNNSIEEQMRNNAKILEIEQEYMKKVIKVQEDACIEAEKEKSEYLNTISELRTSVSKLEDKLEEKDVANVSLQEEVQNLKFQLDANMDTFHKKFAEQERKHQSELEIWKMAELNRSVFDQGQRNNQVTPYGFSQNYQEQQYQPLRPMQGYQHVRFQEQAPTIYQKTPLVTHYKNVLPRHNMNMVRPLVVSENCQKKSDFISASDLYMQSHLSVDSNTDENNEHGGEEKKENKQVVVQKPKILVPNKKRKLFSSNQNML